MEAQGASGAALRACRQAVAEYHLGALDDGDLRTALLGAIARVDDLDEHFDRVVRAALALPRFTDDALTQLCRSIDRLIAVPDRGRTS